MSVYYECGRSIALARLGYMLANGTLDQDAANDIIYECQPVAGWYPIETLSVDRIIEDAGFRWSNPAADIEPFAAQAARRVWNKWDSSGDAPDAASDWACDLIAEYARQDGVALVEGEREDAEVSP